jgi:hypothetical protein
VMKLVVLTIPEPVADTIRKLQATGGGFDADADFGDVGAQAAPPTTTATTAGFSAGAFGGESGISGATTVPMRAPSPSFGGQMYSMSGSGPSASRTISVTATTTTTINPSDVAVGGVLTCRVASTGHAKVIEHIIGLCGFPQDSTMVECMDQQQWEKLEHVATVE